VFAGGFPVGDLHAETFENVKLVTLTGWEYVNVTIQTVEGEPHVVVISEEGGQKKISRSNIRLILDQAGKDITAAVLGRVAPAPELQDGTVRQTPSGTSVPDYRSGNRSGYLYGPRYRVALSCGLGYGLTMGQWFEGLTSGLAFDFTGRIALTENVYFGLTYRYQNLGVEDEWSYVDLYDDYGVWLGTVEVEWDVHLSEVYGLVGFMTESKGLTKPFGFGEMGFGAIGHSMSVKAAGVPGAGSSTNESKFGMLLVSGGVFPLSKTVGLCLQADMRLTGSGSEYGEGTGTSGVLMGIDASLILLLGK